MAKDGSRQKFAKLGHKGCTPKDDPEGKPPEGGAGDDDEVDEEDDEEDDDPEPELKYSDTDVDAIVNKRLKRERAKLEKEIRDSIVKEAEDERTEAEKLASMTELQKAQYEAAKLKREKEALERERDFNNQMAIARSELSDAGIAMGDELLRMFVSAKAEDTSAAIEKLKELWPKEVNAAVKLKLKGEAPPAETDKGGKSYGASYAEQYNKRVNGGK